MHKLERLERGKKTVFVFTMSIDIVKAKLYNVDTVFDKIPISNVTLQKKERCFMKKRLLSLLLALIMLCTMLPQITTKVKAANELSAAPYPKVEYGYSASVQAGTIRYICQDSDNTSYFFWDYWPTNPIINSNGEGYYGPGSECSTACISMALSYVGVNITPYEILTCNSGITWAKTDWGGTTHNQIGSSASAISAAMDNYINGNGKYSPLVIHINPYPSGGGEHHIVLAGKINNDSYLVVDPWSPETYTLTVSNGNAMWKGNTYPIYKVHQWYNPNATPPMVKKEYPAQCAIFITSDTTVKSMPCSKESDPNSKDLETAKKDSLPYLAKGLVENKYGNLWYKVETRSGGIGYIYAGHTAYYDYGVNDISAPGVTVPANHTQEKTYVLSGSVQSTGNRLTEVSVYVYKGTNTQASPVTGDKAPVNGYSYSLAGSTIDNATYFNHLTVGTYTYVVSASYENYYAKSATVVAPANTGTVEVYRATFNVVAGSTSCSHSYTSKVTTVATCVKNGTRTYTCSKCGHSYTETIAATGSHNYVGKVTANAYCGGTGTKTYTCSGCSASYTETIPATGDHTWGGWGVRQAATCTTNGIKARKCPVCYMEETQTIPATGHSYGNWVTTTAAGCTTTGTQKKTCSSCGNVQTQTLAATGHNYQSTTIGATCNDYEKIRYTCSKCQHSYEEYTAEAYSQWSTTKPTGVDASLIETKTQYSYRTISHTTEYSSWSAWSDWSTTRQSTSDLKKEESQTVWGYYYFKCPGCGAHMHGWGITCPTWAGGCGKTYIPEGAYVQVYSPTSWDNAGLKDWHGTGKYYTYINGELVFKWTEGGTNTQYRYATRTSKQVTNYGNWSSWSDTVYTASSTREVKTQTLYRYVQRQLGDHTWDSGKITTQATCTTNGTKTYTCTSCGTTKKETLKATGHNLKEYTEQATCTQEGKYGYVCTKCDYAENAGTIPATGHSYGDWVTTTPAGCTTTGSQKKTCAFCGDVQTQSIAATGHNYSDWATTTAAGCTTTGTQEKTCASCGDVQTQFIAATGHSYGNWITTTAAGCTTTGIQEKSCASCGDKQTQSIAATGHNYVSGYCTSCGGKDPNTATASGTCGDNVRWTLDADGVLTISGTGAMDHWVYNNSSSKYSTPPWKEFVSSIETVVIESGVTMIGSYAFYNCANLQSVTIPESVTGIGVSAFDGCLNLTGVYISDIAAWCNILFGDDVSNPLFYAQKLYLNNELVTELIIPEGVVQINKLAFNNCVSLESVTIPETLETIGSSAFDGCLNLTGVYITNITAWCNINFVVYTANPLSYAKNLYLNDVLVTDLIIPDGVTTILKNAFSGSNVQSITLPESITAIGARAFYGCTVLKNVYFGGSENQWKNINVSADNNCLLNATIHYGGTDAIVGDLTNDEQITNDDVVLLLWHCLFPEENPVAAKGDFTGDGMVTNEDVIKLLWHCLFPEENPL